MSKYNRKSFLGQNKKASQGIIDLYEGVNDMAMQKINCSVCSCAYHAHDKNACTLKDIQVCPCKDSTSGNPQDETCCSSYKAE